MKILVVGGGGREHVLCWKLAQSTKLKEIYCAPGNAGIKRIAQCVNIAADDINGIADFAEKNNIDLVVPGPELPLTLGLADECKQRGINVFGPDSYCAQLEGSKIFAKEFMRKYEIPTADFEVFDDIEAAIKHLDTVPLPTVIKADGLAAGKGVLVTDNREEAADFIREVMQDKVFGEAGNRLLIEECLGGEETSILALTDGKTMRVLTPSQDHKRAYDDDKGPNTGGMGAYSPVSIIDDEMMEEIKMNILQRVVDGMEAEGHPFVGVIYAGLMVTYKGPHVLEFNVRFGDPESQAVLPLIKGDLAAMCLAAAQGEIHRERFEPADQSALCVVMAAGGYPGKYEKGMLINGLDEAEQIDGVVVFHAGTSLNSKGEFVTNGGRVLAVTAVADNLAAAHRNAYEAVARISWEGLEHRKDIGKKELDRIVR